jgi:2',3'-cyclic-nucleotide 2'-phosphodiesterase (5'-nucleotidase family)
VVDSDPSTHKLLLDAGDVLHGEAFATINRGESVANILGMVAYDALAVGNHDFDYGYDRLLELTSKYRLPFLAANVERVDGTNLFPPYLLYEWTDLKIGIFALTTVETKTATNPKNIIGLNITDPIEAAKKMVEVLDRQGADIIIALTHLGSEPYCQPMSQQVARDVAGIDIIIDGHSHSTISLTIERDDGSSAIVASTGSKFENLGKIEINRLPDGTFSYNMAILSADSDEIKEIEPEPAIHAALLSLQSTFSEELSEVLFSLPFDLEGSRDHVRRESTNLGKIIGAALVESTGAQVALVNGGTIRASLQAGEVTKGQLLSVLPFADYVYIIDISGKDLLDALNHGLSQLGSGAFPQFWGLEVQAKITDLVASDGTKSAALAAQSVTIDGKPLDPNKTYTLATNNFLHSGGDG